MLNFGILIHMTPRMVTRLRFIDTHLITKLGQRVGSYGSSTLADLHLPAMYGYSLKVRDLIFGIASKMVT